jgi:hypothetical protein
MAGARGLRGGPRRWTSGLVRGPGSCFFSAEGRPDRLWCRVLTTPECSATSGAGVTSLTPARRRRGSRGGSSTTPRTSASLSRVERLHVILPVIPPGATRPPRSALAGRPIRPDLQGKHTAARGGRSAPVLYTAGWGIRVPRQLPKLQLTGYRARRATDCLSLALSFPQMAMPAVLGTRATAARRALARAPGGCRPARGRVRRARSATRRGSSRGHP